MPGRRKSTAHQDSSIAQPGFALRVAIGLATAFLLLAHSVGWAADDAGYQQGWRAYQAGDFGAAVRLLRSPADAGHLPSQNLLADVLEKAGFFAESVDYYRRAADRGDAQARYGLAMAYAGGRGVARDLAQARELMEASAAQSYEPAIIAVAHAWIAGGLGIEATRSLPPGALALVRKAADGGYLPAIDFLARGYREGTLGGADLTLAERYESQAERLRYPNGRPRERRRN